MGGVGQVRPDLNEVLKSGGFMNPSSHGDVSPGDLHATIQLISDPTTLKQERNTPTLKMAASGTGRRP